MSEFWNRVDSNLTQSTKVNSITNSWQKNTNKSVILLKNTTMSTILLTHKQKRKNTIKNLSTPK